MKLRDKKNALAALTENEEPALEPSIQPKPTAAKSAAAAKPKPAPAKAGAAKPAPKAAAKTAATTAPAPAPKEKAAAKGKAETKRAPLRQRITLSGFLLWTVVGTILVVSGGIGWYAVYTLYQNKLRDTWAIVFLELEQHGNWMVKRLDKFAALQSDASKSSLQGNGTEVVLHVESAKSLRTVRGGMPDQVALSDLGLKTAEFSSRWTILQYAGQDYLAFNAPESWVNARFNERFDPGRYLVLWRIDLTEWLKNAMGNPEKNTVYLITREGRLLFSNRPEITPASFMNRQLVQKFVSAPLRQGQIEFDGDDSAAYGFFYEIPETNIVMFVESSKRVALAQVRSIAIQYGLTLLVVLAMVGILLQIPLSRYVVAPMRELVRVADEVGDGNFDVTPSREGLGELYALSRSFTDMAKNLVVRDKKIQALLVEQQEKFRLADEMAIAHSIQDNFLIDTPLPRESGLEVASQYTPATEVAGDWYGYFFEPSTGQTVIAVADVSGHGAGSAMFTAIIAAAFEEMRGQAAQGVAFPLEDFAVKLNRLIVTLGKGGIHATMAVATYTVGSERLSVLNAGHPFPLIMPPPESNFRGEPIPTRSDALGLSADFRPSIAEVEFSKGMSLFMYTDGLIEGSPDRRLYTERRITKATRLNPGQNINQMVIRVYEDWKKFLAGQPPLDDVCLLAVRAVV